MNIDTKSGQPSTELPSGTVTFLFTDIEGSTELLKQLGGAYATLLADQRKILREVFSRWNGQEVDIQGDSFFVSFPRATEAVAAAVEIQTSLSEHAWPEGAEVRVRMGLHTGEPLVAEEGYVGMDVHRAARIAHVGHGGQVLLSETTSPLVRGELPEGVSLLDLGRHRLKDMRVPEHIRQLVIEGLPSEFPPLKSLEALLPEIPLEVGPVVLPAFLVEKEETPVPVFVERERELKRLSGLLERALEGEGGIAFVTGGPGRGKTALMHEFSRRAMDAHSELLVAKGSCNAFTGAGDPYLPFRQVTAMLTGDLEAGLRAGMIRHAHALRIWNAMPLVVQTIMEMGQDLIGILVTARDLLSRTAQAIESGSIWLERLATLADRGQVETTQMQQGNIFEGFVQVMGKIAPERPLLFLLDDLQWADKASIDMLFHIGRHLEGKRVLIVGAYRPEEVLTEGGLGQHPLQMMLSEFKRLHGDVWIDLGKIRESESRQFVEALLEEEFNAFSTEFRDSLFHRTGGHPLFTVELLREVKERGHLAEDDQGRWMAPRVVDWRILPARVEGVIEARLSRIDSDMRDLLTVASVEGVEFTAELLALVQATELGVVLQQLEKLEERYRLIIQHGFRQIGDQRLCEFRFRHQLFQNHLYDHVNAARKAHLHDKIAREMERLYAEDAAEAAVDLAWHYMQAGNTRRAVDYIIQAGDRAARMSAHQEAVGHYQNGLDLIPELPRSEKRDQKELALNMGLTLSLITLRGYGDREVGSVVEKTLELGKVMGDPSQIFLPSLAYVAFLGSIAEYGKAEQAWMDLMTMADRMGDTLFIALSHWPGWIPLMQGDFSSSLSDMNRIIKFYDVEQHSELRHTFGVDPGAISRLWASWPLWLLGYPDQAEGMIHEAFQLATILDHAHTLAFVLGMGCLVYSLRGDLDKMEEWAEAALEVSEEHGIKKFYGDGLINLGVAMVAKGQYEDGIEKIREGISLILDTGMKLGYSINLLRLAEALGEADRHDEAIQVLDQSMDFMQDTGEEIMAAEYHRIRARLLSETGVANNEVELIYLRGLEVARQQGSRSLELRTLIDLCQLWDGHSKQVEAKSMLRECYQEFREGFKTLDLQRAAALLDEG